MNEQQTRAPSRQLSLKEQRARRRRVNRIKTGIILFIVGWLTLCMILNVFLLIRVSSIQKQVDVLTESTLNRTQVSVEDLELVPGDTDVSKQENTQEQEQLSQEEQQPEEEPSEDQWKTDVRACISGTDNIRSEGDGMNVYLTFDDGPSENTEEILAVLKEHGVKATFFVTGKEGEDAKKRYQEIVNQGHTLAMHSYTHRYSEIYDSLEAFKQDFTSLKTYLKDITGVDCKVYRFPGGSSNQVSNTDMNVFIDYIGEQGMVYYDWNVACGDATTQIYTADELVSNVMKDVVKYKNSVVLMHDSSDKDTTVQALRTILDQLQALDASVLPITEESAVIHHTINTQ